MTIDLAVVIFVEELISLANKNNFNGNPRNRVAVRIFRIFCKLADVFSQSIDCPKVLTDRFFLWYNTIKGYVLCATHYQIK